MVDFSATRDTGIALMHVWAYSNSGEPSNLHRRDYAGPSS